VSTTEDGSNRAAEPNQPEEDRTLPGCGPGGRGFESRRSPSSYLQITIFCVRVDRPRGKRGERSGLPNPSASRRCGHADLAVEPNSGWRPPGSVGSYPGGRSNYARVRELRCRGRPRPWTPWWAAPDRIGGLDCTSRTPQRRSRSRGVRFSGISGRRAFMRSMPASRTRRDVTGWRNDVTPLTVPSVSETTRNSRPTPLVRAEV